MKIRDFFKQTYRFSTSTPARLTATIVWLVYAIPGIWTCLCRFEKLIDQIIGPIFYHGFWFETNFIPAPERVWLPFLGNLGIYNDDTPNKAIYLLVVLVLIWIGSISIYSRKVQR